MQARGSNFSDKNSLINDVHDGAEIHKLNLKEDGKFAQVNQTAGYPVMSPEHSGLMNETGNELNSMNVNDNDM